MDAVAGLSVENEHADAGRDGRTCLARPKSSRANGDRVNILFPCSADYKQEWQPPYLVDPYSAESVDQTYK